MDNEINFFLDEAMKAAEQVADDITLTNNTGLTNPKNISGIVGWNPYFEMFAEEDMSSYSEVLFWKQYMNGGGVSITHGTPAYIFTGGNNGMLKSFVDCFVMKDGLPYYAAGDEYKGDKTIMDVKENRDLRLQMFVWAKVCFHPVRQKNLHLKNSNNLILYHWKPKHLIIPGIGFGNA